MFSQQFYALGGSALGLTPGDALLVYLAVYRYSDAIESTPAQVRENLSKLWDEIKILTRPQAVELQLDGGHPLPRHQAGRGTAAQQAEYFQPAAQ